MGAAPSGEAAETVPEPDPAGVPATRYVLTFRGPEVLDLDTAAERDHLWRRVVFDDLGRTQQLFQAWRAVCDDRRVAARALKLSPARRTANGGSGRRITLFQRLFLAYALVLGVAAAVLVLAPITVSVPTALRELAIILAGFVAMLLAYRVLLHRALAPLERLTGLMRRVDPLTPGQRVEAADADAEVAALAEAFNEMLDRLEGERRESGRRALMAQESERRRIARELHDEIGQILTGLVLRSETLVRRAPADLRDDIAGLREAARHGAEEVRQIAQRLRPEALDELGLQSALLALATGVAEPAGLNVTRTLESGLSLTREQELVIYRVAQESLTNVVRHAGAERVELSLRRDGEGVRLTVRDDGIGLPDDADQHSNGIRGMRERALLVGATLGLRRLTPSGTEVVLRVPHGELR
jgi:two-component system sensor histidine kinase UhpB